MRHIALLCTLIISKNLLAGIHGQDDRVEINQAPKRIQRLAKSVGALIRKTVFEKPDEVQNLQQMLGLCQSQPFSSTPSFANCTATLVAPNKILTAAHCIDDDAGAGMDDLVVVFGADQFSTSKHRYKLIKKIYFEFNFPGPEDRAIIELDRDVEGIEPLKLASMFPLHFQKVFAIGHPLGVSQIYAPNSRITEILYQDESFRYQLDLFSCNSGSPIISGNRVVGVHVRGTGLNLSQKPEGCYEWYRSGKDDYEEANWVYDLSVYLND